MLTWDAVKLLVRYGGHQGEHRIPPREVGNPAASPAVTPPHVCRQFGRGRNEAWLRRRFCGGGLCRRRSGLWGAAGWFRV